ncbi:MAG: hypothetical protein GC191_00805 [Azospirillum sp.]|nr:hypothetical protein [Azospirillum sp.]
MLLRKKKVKADVAEGALFCRLAGDKVVETARVLAISQDLVGIPHVRFRVHHERTEASDELRTLSLASFKELFCERATA